MSLFDRQVADDVARMTHAIKSYVIRPDRPFIYNSRIISPDYQDMRRFAMYAGPRERLIQYFLEALDSTGVDFDIIAGHESADIPFQAIVADRLRKPALVVRKEAKGHGMGEKLMGAYPDEIKGKNVVHVGDLMTKAKAACNVAFEVRGCGGYMDFHVVGFDRLQGGEETLAKLEPHVNAISLCEKDDSFYQVGLDMAAISKEDLGAVREYGTTEESQRVWATKFLRGHPEFFENELKQPGAVVDGEIKKPDALEVLTKGYPGLLDEFKPVVIEACRGLGVEDPENILDKVALTGLGKG